MADLSDVSKALGALIGSVLYPSGASGENPSPVVNAPVRVEVGWPSPQALDTAVKTSKTHISIYPRPGERSTSRAQQDFFDLTPADPTYAMAASGNVITASGAPPNPFAAQNVVAVVNGKPYAVAASPGESASSIAAALRALIVVDVPGTTVAGPAITLPADARIGALRVGTVGIALRELDRQERDFQITVWAPNPGDRDLVSSVVDVALRQVNNLLLADGSYGRLSYKGSPFSDFDQKQGLFRRDLIYAVDYPTTLALTVEQIVVSECQLQPAPDGQHFVETVTLYA